MKITKKSCKNKHEIDTKIFQKKKRKKGEYRKNKYKNMSEKDKEKLEEYKKTYGNAKKRCYKKICYLLLRTV